MALALVAGKDRDSVRNAQFMDFRDGGWWNERSKTEARVYLPVRLRLRVFGMSLEDVLKQCRSTGVVSRYLVHQTQRAKGATLGKPLHVDMITRTFSAELAKLGIDWGDKEPPTFHEIRSLAARLYKEQGDIKPQDLLSHKDPKSTALYTDGRGEWVKLNVPE
jgi:integrase